MDPLAHLNSFSVYPRPLMRNLFENDTYRRMYLAHTRTIIEENFANQEYRNRALFMQNLIDADVAADTNKFYSYTDFIDNLTTTVSDLIDYPGITDLMDARVNYLTSYPGFLGAPTLSNISVSASGISLGEELSVIVEATSAGNVYLAYRYGGLVVFKMLEMLDDGTQNDGSSSDGIFGRTLTNTGNVIDYYIYAENDSAGRFSPERAAYEFYTLSSQIDPGDLVINEVLASNTITVSDQNGEFDDWIELYNTTISDISTRGLFLADSGQLNVWPIPDVVIPNNGYLIVWADQDAQQDGLHSDFQLDSDNDGVFLFYGDSTIIDSVQFENQNTDVSLARIPNGSGNFVESEPTFNRNNESAEIKYSVRNVPFKLYPNPTFGELKIAIAEGFRPSRLEVVSIDGRRLLTHLAFDMEEVLGLDISSFKNGMYFVQLYFDNFVFTEKLLIQQ